LKNKIILTGLFLTSAISCSNFKPVVFTEAYLNPLTTTNVTIADLNFQYALFNQYASGLSYKFRMEYSVLGGDNLNLGILANVNGGSFFFNSWDIVTSSFAEAELDSTWRQRLNTILFNRQFVTSTGLADQNDRLQLFKQSTQTVNYAIKIRSQITYNVDVGALFLAFYSQQNIGIDQFEMFINFYNRNDQLLNTIRFDTDRTATVRNRLYDLPKVITGVAGFELWFNWLDIPPFQTAPDFNNVIQLFEFNLFTNQQEIKIPDDPSGDIFGFEFVAVEWWDILGHLQNFAWWIVNKSPISPLFEWIDDYVITWVSGLITFITGIFRL